MSGLTRDDKWDSHIIVVRESGADTVWDGHIKNMVYNTVSMAWEAQVPTVPGGAGDATAANQVTGNSSLSSIDTKLTSQSTAANQTTANTSLGGVTETAPATDTASSGLNGRLQRLAQRITSLIAQIPAALGQLTKANSLSVVLASDQTPFADVRVNGTTTNVGDVVTISCAGIGTVGFTTSGTWVGTHVIEASQDGGVTFPNPIYALGRTTAAALFTSVTTNIGGDIPVSGITHLRLRRTVATSGVATIDFTGNVTTHVVHAYSLVPQNFAVTASMLTLTKGTQGATGVSVQNLKDAGRNVTNYFMALPVVTSATDALVSLTGYKGGVAVGTTATPAVVTAAKIYRITSISITYVAIATAGTVAFTLRANTGGVVAISSPAVCTWVSGAPAATAGVSQTYDIVIPDGLEFAAGTGIGVSMLGLGATQASAIVGYGQIAINGYEY